MKTLSTTLLTAMIFCLCSCKGKHDYRLKLIYMTTDSKGIPILVDRGNNITASSDSAAYAKALKVDSFKTANNPHELHDQYDHFELINSEGMPVTSEALEKHVKTN